MYDDYFLLYVDNKINIIKSKLRDNTYVKMNSITKYFVILAIEYLINKKIINYNDPVVKYYKKYKYDKIRIIDIIKHKSGIVNDWYVHNIKNNKWIKSETVAMYLKADDIYDFTLKLDVIPQNYGKIMPLIY